MKTRNRSAVMRFKFWISLYHMFALIFIIHYLFKKIKMNHITAHDFRDRPYLLFIQFLFLILILCPVFSSIISCI